MNRRSARRLAACLILALAGLLSTPLPRPAVKAQSNQRFVEATSPLFRFRVSNTNRGYMLHPFASAGQNLGYTNEGSIWPSNLAPGNGGLVLPQGPGVTPAAGQFLIPIYQWRVVQSGRTYYYYSGPSHNGGSGYYFEGQLGWVLPANFVSGTVINGRQIQSAPIHYYYSTRYGYWYSAFRPEQSPTILCFPDTCNVASSSYVYQGVGFQIPLWAPRSACIDPTLCGPPTFIFNEPPPPPQCDPEQEQSCFINGGSWNPSTCSCSFDVDPDPCGGGFRVCQQLENVTTEEPATTEEPPPSPDN